MILRTGTASIGAAIVLLLGASPALADEFYKLLARVDHVLANNPDRAPGRALDSCMARRNFAMRLAQAGQTARAERSLQFCIDILHIPDPAEAKPEQVQTATVSMEEIQAQAALEVEKALTLTPNIAHGLEIYRSCAMCHMPEGFGLENGSVPQLAGQHRSVVIKQLADIRAGNRDNFLMLPYSSVESIGGTQAVADVAGYIDTLEISIATGKGRGDDLELGGKIYGEQCARCHGAAGEGDAKAFVPRIQAQHYNYLVRQFQLIRDGKRHNSNPEMVSQIQEFGEKQTHAVLDYVSRLEPPEELQAPPGWHNPDFAKRD